MAQKKSKLIINIFIVAAIIGTAVLSYLFLTGGDEEADTEIGNVSSGGDVIVISEGLNSLQLMALVKRLKAMRLNIGIVKAEDFKSLKDFTVSIQKKPRGVKNPFGTAGF